ncbi:MAG: phycocyanobilin:ferredoxin oxidoreductase [Gloeocapsa sp. DLM2.Bin57]|nr:MAG: phycocyanobilin:ferredoxin oxidoreductase [Gloeocapsa sp. DLM2.Bin57]
MIEIAKTELREQLHPMISQLADIILTQWSNNLKLSPYQIPSELGYVEGKLEGEKITIQNHCYQTPQLRKLHLELAKVGKNLDVLHCVMFPNPAYTLPIFGCDIVVGRGEVSAAIVDLSPVSLDHSLPENYQQALASLPELNFSQVRQLPEWGDIFSEYVVFIRPTNTQEIADFLARVDQFLSIHTSLAAIAQPATMERQQLNLARQHHYCTKQRQNDKTRKVLEKAFGTTWAETYFNNILFDLPA